MAVAGPSTASGGIGPAPHAGWIRRTAESLFSVLFPSDCRLDRLPLLNIARLPACPDGLGLIEPIRRKVCSICGERALSCDAVCDDGLRRCPVCRRVDRPFERAVAYGSYDGGLRELVHLLKFHGVKPAANVLGRMLGEAIVKLELGGKIGVIPVPLYRATLGRRGFPPAELIARAAIKVHPVRDQLQLFPDILERTRDTHSHIGLTSRQRRKDLRGAFSVARAVEVTGREVLLVDDVYITGATASECARVLRRAGAAKVFVATVARTLKLASKTEGFTVSEFQGFTEDLESAEASEFEHLETLQP